MHVTSQQQLKKQKRRLSLIFTLILFFVVVVLQNIFLAGKYIESANREFKRMSLDMPRIKMFDNMISGGELPSAPMAPNVPMTQGDGRGWRLKGGNMVVYNPNIGKIITSSLGDDNLAKEIVEKIEKQNDADGIIDYNNDKLLFVKKEIAPGHRGFFFIPTQVNISEVVRDSLLFMIFFGFCSIIFYYIIYWFVGKMFAPIEENMHDMEQFIFNAGHELKTPLSVIKSHLQLALAKKQYKEYVDDSILELDKMNSLLEALINISVVHQDTNKEEINIQQEIKYLIGQFSNLAKDRSVTVKLDIENNFNISANRGHIHMLLGNLISNAIKYNKKNGKVKITISDGYIKIQDTGIGIPAGDMGKIFDRFYQVGNSRNQDGFGIGLALVKKIVDMYSWKITVDSQENIGSTFTIRFK